MQFKDIFVAWFIIVFMCCIMFGNMIAVDVNKMKNPKGKDKCDPGSMFFADDGEERVKQCVQKQSSYDFGNMMGPVYNVMDNAIEGIKLSVEDTQGIRASLSNLNKLQVANIGSIFNVFNTIFVQFQYIIAKLKDSFGKIIGLGTMFLYTADGTRLLLMSIWNGPLGKIVEGIEGFMDKGSCFHPDTPIQLSNNKVIKMKDVKVGDILINDNEVIATMIIKGNKKCIENNKNPYYKLYSKRLKSDILVTGTHYININGKNTMVKNMDGIEPIYGKETEFMYCLVTKTNFIDIGEYCFCDWEFH